MDRIGVRGAAAAAEHTFRQVARHERDQGREGLYSFARLLKRAFVWNGPINQSGPIFLRE